MARHPKINAPTEITTPTGELVEAIGGELPGANGLSTQNFAGLQLWGTRKVFEGAVDLDTNRTELEIDRRYLGLPGVDQWCSLGSSIQFYPCYFHLDNLDAIVPWSDPPEAWRTWGQASNGSHAPQEIPVGSGNWYRSNNEGESGDEVDAVFWYSYIEHADTANTGIVEVLTVEQYQAIQQANAPTEP